MLTTALPQLIYSITSLPPVYTNMQGTFNIPENIKTIEPNAFEDSQLSTIIIPDSVTFIGRMAFTGCSNLTDIYIPLSVKKIQEFAFSSCPKLTIHYAGEDVPSTWSKKWNSGRRPVNFGEY